MYGSSGYISDIDVNYDGVGVSPALQLNLSSVIFSSESESHTFSLKPSGYSVTFDTNGHGTAPDTQTIASGEKVTEPTAPTAEGWTFGGWYKEAECTNAWDFANDTVTEATTLYAKWKANHSVTVNSATNGTVTADKSTTVEGDTVTLTVTPDSGYELDTLTGIYSGMGLVNTTQDSQNENKYTFEMPDADVTVSATFKEAASSPTNYTVTFDAKGGSAVASATVESGNKVSKPTNPTRSGYTFAGWYADAAYTAVYNFDTAVTDNLTLYAKWTSSTPYVPYVPYVTATPTPTPIPTTAPT
ncbi:MAG: InlB B-repeat-containing protein, partial [Lachnospiraceae bacterium]|nr:InlB B-repeat-containing protein [Lachnospiraceae bacterium]